MSLNMTASVQLAFFYIHTGLKSVNTPFINSTVDNATSNERQSSAGLGRPRLQLASDNSILHHAPYLIVDWIKIRAILRP